jgi:ABC-2 type transport system ATP-binding protein
MKAAVQIKRLSVTREKQPILMEASATIGVGQVVGLLGPSGAGKTTLIRAIVGIQKPTAGSVTVFGQAAGSASLRKDVGYMTQAPSVYSDLTVYENLRYFAAMTNVGQAEIQQTMREVQIHELAGRLTGSLSGGQRARVSLAVALLGRPKLLVLDEPTVGLDPVLREELWNHFHRLAEAGTTLLISSHVMDEASRCHNILLVREGRILADGTPAELQARTQTQDMGAAFLRLIGDAS